MLGFVKQLVHNPIFSVYNKKRPPSASQLSNHQEVNTNA